MAVIKDVAREAGLSVSAVSKYLKDPTSVRPDTRERIEAAIEKLDYRPSRTARALRTGRAQLIAVILNDLTNPFYAEISDTIREALAAAGYGALILTDRQDDGGYYRDALQMVDGAIVCFATGAVLPRGLRIPTVTIGWRISGDHPDDVALDLKQGMAEVTQHLIQSGKQRIAFVGSGYVNSNSRHKQAGYAQEMAAAGRVEQVLQVGFRMQDGYNAARQLMRLPEPPDAIIAENDILAIGCLKYCLRHGYHVPEQVAIAGCDDIAMAAMYEPPLTTARMPLKAMGEAAVARMMQLLDGSTPDAPYRMQTTLMVRATTDAAYRQDLSQLEV